MGASTGGNAASLSDCTDENVFGLDVISSSTFSPSTVPVKWNV